MWCYQFLSALAYTTVSHAYVGSCNSYFLPPLLTLYKIFYIDVTYFKVGASTVKTVPKFEFRGSNLLRDDRTTSRLSSWLRKANYAPHVLGATPSIYCTESTEMYTEVYVTRNNERHNSGYPSSIFLKQVLRHRYMSQLAVDHRLPAVAKWFVTGNFFIITMLFFRGWKSLLIGKCTS